MADDVDDQWDHLNQELAEMLERYDRKPREGEIVCHNHVEHTRRMAGNRNGFRYWCADKPPAGWKVCPCGWKPELGVHYANPRYVAAWREMRRKLGSQAAVDRHVEKIVRAAR